jgi:hypothetical protein
MPPSPDVDEFVNAVTVSWRDAGGEPDIGLRLPRWIDDCGLKISSMRPIVDIVSPSHPSWAWLRAFLEAGSRRLVDLGYLSSGRAAAIRDAFARLEASPGTLMVTPGVVEVIARRQFDR